MKKIFFPIVTLFAFGALLFTSCERVDMPNEIAGTQEQFHTTLRMNMDNVGDIPIGGGNRSGLLQATSMQAGELQTIYLDIQNITPDVQELIDNVSTLRDISELVVNYGAVVESANENSNRDVQFSIPVREAQRSLEPMVEEAINYLRSRGFSGRDIENLLERTGATRYDLVPLVIFLQESAFADNPFANCATMATGVELTARVSSRTAIEQVFEASVSLNSGAVMSAIAVGNYRHCLVAEMDVVVYAMLTSNEFVEMREKQKAFVDMIFFEGLSEMEQCDDFDNITTVSEMMVWIENNISYTAFASAAEASSMFNAVENKMKSFEGRFISPRIEKEAKLFDERMLLGMTTLGAGPTIGVTITIPPNWRFFGWSRRGPGNLDCGCPGMIEDRFIFGIQVAERTVGLCFCCS